MTKREGLATNYKNGYGRSVGPTLSK